MPLPFWTQQQILDQLIGPPGTRPFWPNPTITYAFADSLAGLNLGGDQGSFSAFTAEQRDAGRLAISLWDDLIQQTLQETAHTGTTDIEFANFNAPAGGYAYAFFPTGGTAWFNIYYNGSPTQGGETNDLLHPRIGDHGFETFVHELGHAFGLDHAGNYNGAGAEPTNFQDSTIFSIMSYFGPSWGDGINSITGQAYSTEVAWADWVASDNQLYSPQTPMINDIMAVQQAYGASTTTRTDNTVYGFNSTIAGAAAAIYDFTQNTHPVLCIYDSAGLDTIDLSGYSTATNIDLNAGAFSDCDAMTKNLSIAYGVVIENAIGGSAGDNLTGNEVGNVLTGRGGADIINGNGGNDTASYAGSVAGVTVDLRLATAQVSGGDASGDTLTSIENLEGSANADTLIGTTGTNVLTGGDGNDLLLGLEGDDTLRGGIGQDTLNGGSGLNSLFGDGGEDSFYGGSGTDIIDGGDGTQDIVYYNGSATGVTVNLTTNVNSGGDAAGDSLVNVERVFGSVHADSLTGNGGNNTLYGFDGIDTLIGLGGNDILFGGLGNDVFNGGSGINTLNGEGGEDTFYGGSGTDIINGGDGTLDIVYYNNSAAAVTVNLATNSHSGGDAAGDSLTNVERVFGSIFGDTLTGNNGDNYLYGYDGADILIGLGGNDIVFGGIGNDVFNGGTGTNTLNGEGGEDTFFAGSGNDIINGGDGVLDIVYYNNSTSGITVNLLTNANSGGDAAGDNLVNVERVFGSIHTDSITGNDANNYLYGYDGIDTLQGGLGSDQLYGGADADTFRFTENLAGVATYGSDTIHDFVAGSDRLAFSSLIATDIADFTLSGNGTNTVTLAIDGQTITLRGTAPITLTNADIDFV